MKVLQRQISSKDGDGFVRMKTEEAEDMWHAYNLITIGDRVRTSTVRKVRVICYILPVHHTEQTAASHTRRSAFRGLNFELYV